MSSIQMSDLIRYRIEQAKESYQDAQTLFDAGSLRGSINRAYYAMFYAALSLIATRRLGTSKHSGVIAFFDRDFVKTGIFPPNLSKSFHLAFDQRQVHDYGELIAVDEEIAEQTLQDAKQFVSVIEQYLRNIGYLN